MEGGRRTDDFNVATGVNFGVAPSSSWSKFGCNPEVGIMSIGAPQKTTAFFKGEHLQQAQTNWPAPISPQGQTPRFPHGWLKMFGLPGYPRW